MRFVKMDFPADTFLPVVRKNSLYEDVPENEKGMPSGQLHTSSMFGQELLGLGTGKRRSMLDLFLTIAHFYEADSFCSLEKL